MSEWNSDALAGLRQVAIDLTSLSASVEVVRDRHPDDPAVMRAVACVESLVVEVTGIIDRLRER